MNPCDPGSIFSSAPLNKNMRLCLRGCGELVRTSRTSSMMAQLTASSLAPGLWHGIEVTVDQKGVFGAVVRLNFDNYVLDILVVVRQPVNKFEVERPPRLLDVHLQSVSGVGPLGNG